MASQGPSLLLLLLWVWLAGGKAQRAADEHSVWTVSGGRAELPCTPAPREADDNAVLVLWYRSTDTLQPVFSYDARLGVFDSGESWANPEVLGKRATFNTLSSPPVLLLKPVLGSDQGTYSCRVDYRLSPSTISLVNLTVAIPPEAPVLAWRGAAVSGLLGPLQEGDDVEILCRSKGGRPPPQLTWWWLGARLPSQESSLLETNPGVVESKLLVTASRALHGASLTCHAQTPAPDQASAAILPEPLSSSVILNVTLPPVSVAILGSNEPVSAGVTINLACRAMGSHPPAKITWWEGHNHLSEVTSLVDDGGNMTTATLRLTVRQEHNGATLACTATNPLLPHAPITASRRLEVFYKPIVTLQMGKHLDASTLREGNDVFFECTVKANPPVSRIDWYHNGGEVVQNLSQGVVVNEQILVIRNLHREHSGHYTCAAANQEGHNTSSAVQLRVQHAPVCAGGDLQRTLGVARGSPVIVTCRVEALPATHLSWTWMKILESGEEQPIPAEEVQSAGLTSSVELRPLTTQDYGDVVCSANNIVGRQREPCVVSLIPAGPPDAPMNCSAALSNPEDTTALTHSLVVACLEGFDGGLPQKFVLEAWQNGHVVANITRDFPEWTVKGLEGGLATRLYVLAANARGRSLKLQLEVPIVRAQHQAAPKSKGLGVPTLLGAAAGVVAVLLLSLLVSVMIARRSRSCCTKDTAKNNPNGTPKAAMWECYEARSRHTSQGHCVADVDTLSQPYTSLLHSPSDSPAAPSNGRILNYSPKRDKVETSGQIIDSCSDSSFGSRAESVVEVAAQDRPLCSGQDTEWNTKPNHYPMYTTARPPPAPLNNHILPRNGTLPHTTPCHSIALLPQGARSVMSRGNECNSNGLSNHHNKNFFPSRCGDRTVILHHQGDLGIPFNPQGGPKRNRRPRYELFYPPRKPPRAFSQTLFSNGAAPRGSFTSLCSSNSQPVPHNAPTGGSTEWQCPQAPLAEDEVKDAYVPPLTQ